MLQRLGAFLLLLIHINGSMLLSQQDESDIYCNGRPVDDINSVIEYVQQEVLHIQDSTPEDEDDDKGRDIKLVKAGDNLCEQAVRSIQITRPEKDGAHRFFDLLKEPTFLISYDIITPPPKV